MKTLDANEAASVLKLHPVTLKRLARERRIPARKVGNAWIFEESILLEWLRGDYDTVAKNTQGDTKKMEVKPCHSTNVIQFGGSVSQRPMDSAYAAALGLPTNSKRKNTTTR